MENKINTVLLVDDNEATNFLNKILLEQCGFARHIEVATNGFDALDYVSGRKSGNKCLCPHLIFLDGYMPLLDGWEFLREIERIKWNLNFLPMVVMLTGC